MLKITVIALGKLKEKYLRDAFAEYAKRIGRFCKFQFIEIDAVKLPENPSETQIKAALDLEGTKIESKLPSGTKKIPLCIEGNMLSSPQLAEYMEKSAMTNGNFTFIIGSSYGLCDKIKEEADLKLSMSPMTFPHQLARIMLLEQIYRAFKILNGGTYHK